ncbi:hypothetical protein CSB45_10685 [candidate division KSB3 bacterium]|uniref:Zinc finger/thioredoxin putative domain-containing protein n=1 Tax=candidate division KSB3 bacterium TaxID=2044937 RepID=A0A2G6E3M0_9BACT|nr:MAG: hypothetical protein CSB45_10685 [candidate division KSB3 bacterium]PIE29126.1 MAG: hypothetical protein CSA57_09940 [candidate division KSB3 bacterium]
MRIQCPGCGIGGKIPAEKIPAEGRKIVCPKCKHPFFVRREKAAAVAQQGANLSAYYDEGVKLLKARQFDVAIEKLNAVIRENPDYAHAYRYLGLAYGQKQLWDEAIQTLQKAVTYQENDLLSLKNLGVAFLHKERFSEAEEVFKRVLRENPDDTRVTAQLEMALRKGQQAGAERENGRSPDLPTAADTIDSQRKSAEPLQENPVLAFLDQGADYLEAAQYGKALESFEEAVRLAPDSPDGHFGLGMTHEKKQEWKKAIAAYQKALELNPKDFLTQETLRYLKKRRKKRFGLLPRMKA